MIRVPAMLRSRNLAGDAIRFVAVGSAGALLHLALYTGARLLDFPPLPANAFAVAVSMTFSYAGHSRLTFHGRKRNRRPARVAGFTVTFLTTLGVSSVFLELVARIAPSGLLWENGGLVLAQVTVAAIRFSVLRWIVFLGDRSPAESIEPPARSGRPADKLT